MAMQTQRTTSSEARAQMLLANAANWSRGTVTTRRGETIGVVLFASASQLGTVYMTRCDGRGCDCPGAQRTRTGICCHQIAVAREAEQAREAVGPKMRYDELMDQWLDEKTGTVAAF